jgi:alkaline phosphatase
MNMKKVIFLTIAMLLVFSGMSFAAVAQSKHDMRSAAGGISDGTISGSTTQVCVFCHHPHRTNKSAAAAKALWNRDDPTMTYTLYDAPKGTEGAAGVLDADTTEAHFSRICLSCHDSTYSVNVVTTAPAGASGGFVGWDVASKSAQADIGGDTGNLQNDHPVDMNYDFIAVGYTTDFVATATVTTSGWKLYNNTVQCGTCHDPHNTVSTDGIQFIRDADLDGTGNELDSSKMCTDCHKK